MDGLGELEGEAYVVNEDEVFDRQCSRLSSASLNALHNCLMLLGLFENPWPRCTLLPPGENSILCQSAVSGCRPEKVKIHCRYLLTSSSVEAVGINE